MRRLNSNGGKRTRAGNIQMLVAGVVLFFSGAMTGGYVVWSHFQVGQNGQANSYQQTSGSSADTNSSDTRDDPFGGQPNVQIPTAHAIGTKSSLTFTPPQDPSKSDFKNVFGAPPKLQVASPPQSNPGPVQPPAVYPGGTKQVMILPPSQFGNLGGGGSNAQAPVLPSITAPQAIPFGTKSAPVFVPSANSKPSLPSLNPAPVPANDGREDWRPTFKVPAANAPSPRTSKAQRLPVTKSFGK